MMLDRYDIKGHRRYAGTAALSESKPR
jgi:hypothetical protein